MTERIQYATRIECIDCGAMGVIYLSEDDRPLIRKLSRKIDKIEGDFAAEMEGNVQIKVTCKSCGRIFTS